MNKIVRHKSTYIQVAILLAFAGLTTVAAICMHHDEPKIIEHDVDAAKRSVKDAMGNTVNTSAQHTIDTYKKIEEERIAAEEAARKAAEEEAAKKAAEEKEKAQKSVQQNTQYSSNGNIDLRSAGVVDWGGHRFTWYSQNALPGGGLDIPGRHVNSAGFVCDGDGFIVAATAYGRGTTGNSPWGAWKSYDTGVSGNTVDLYTNW